MANKAGILYVTMQPEAGLLESQFHDWYNNEHGPVRLRLPFFTNGFRYRASDLEGKEPSEAKPEWMTVYDITDMTTLTEDTYLRLRGPPCKTPREAETMAQIKVDKKLYDFLESREAKEFKRLEEVENDGRGNIMIAVILEIHPGEEMKERLEHWYREEHIEMMSRVPGWLRTRRFVTSSIDSNSPTEYLALYEYAPGSNLRGPELIAATTTPLSKEVNIKVIKEKKIRAYNLCYTFGAAPRYLAPTLSNWNTTDPAAPITTRVFSTTASGAEAGAIESYITTPDGVHLSYRLEGSEDLDAPFIICCNSVLVNYGIWDDFLTSFFSSPENKKYRVLRYCSRGRSSACGDKPITVDVLASDIISILDTLRVPKAAAVIGASLGGATALNTALKYPSRVNKFISCDTSSKSPAGNAKTWSERISLSEKESAISPTTNETIVGQDLAEITVRRWFVPKSYANPTIASKVSEVKNMVATNSLEGFRKGVRALFEYDLKEEMKRGEVEGLFVVGDGDGVLPTTMKDMAAVYGKEGAQYEVIENAGHLPMVENPAEFAAVVGKFLRG